VLTVRRFVFGPWPVHPGVLWTILGLLLGAGTLRVVGFQPVVPTVIPLAERLAVILGLVILAPGLVVVPLIIYTRVRRRFVQHPVRSPEYLLSLAGAAAIGALVVTATSPLVPLLNQVLGDPRFVDTFVRAFVPLWLVNAVIGTAFVRIQRESDAAQAALQTTVAQRRLLLESEERVRGQVAAYLHDRVQTDLVSIGLRMRSAIGLAPEQMASEIEAGLAELERVRADEVRRASRQLSPNLTRITLATALRELAEAYQPGMHVTISVSDAAAARLGAGEDVNRATGIYRICEQGLLNAAVHGHATECSIQVGVNDHDEFVLEIHDNGVGLSPAPAQPGMGSTVISAWTETLGGHWTLESATVGATLTAVIPSA
jgi:signal transduction histidine kinase